MVAVGGGGSLTEVANKIWCGEGASSWLPNGSILEPSDAFWHNFRQGLFSQDRCFDDVGKTFGLISVKTWIPCVRSFRSPGCLRQGSAPGQGGRGIFPEEKAVVQNHHNYHKMMPKGYQSAPKSEPKRTRDPQKEALRKSIDFQISTA